MNSVAERHSAYQDLKADGVAITFRNIVPGIYNPEAGQVSNEPVDYPTYGVITSYKLTDVNNTIIAIGDRQVIMAVTDNMPLPGTEDILIINGVNWKIVTIDPVAPQDIPIIYKCQVRK